MTVRETIERKITAALAPAHLEVINESHMHSVPPDSDSQFKLVIVSQRFADELAGDIHALSLRTLTPGEWLAKGGAIPDSPPCLGGGRAET